MRITVPDRGNTPDKIVEYGIQQSKENIFDKIFCVFDKDEHTSYQMAIDRVKSSNEPIYAITSVPCFEYWFLLHFCSSTKPYYCKGKKTASELVVKELKKYWREYTKNKTGIYEKLKGSLPKALKNAERIAKQQDRAKTDNPSTQVHFLVRSIQELC